MSLTRTLHEVRACHICSANLPFGPRPVLQLASTARLLIIGQAPGSKVHRSGIPWRDASGDRLRDGWIWTALSSTMRRELQFSPWDFAILGLEKTEATIRRGPNVPRFGINACSGICRIFS
jgi:uracil-DNA glycosylase